MARDRRGVKSIFDEAAEIASPEGRAAYLDRACGGDADIRKKVDALLGPWTRPAASWEATPALDASISPMKRSAPRASRASPAKAKGTAAMPHGPDPGCDEDDGRGRAPCCPGPNRQL